MFAIELKPTSGAFTDLVNFVFICGPVRLGEKTRSTLYKE